MANKNRRTSQRGRPRFPFLNPLSAPEIIVTPISVTPKNHNLFLFVTLFPKPSRWHRPVLISHGWYALEIYKIQGTLGIDSLAFFKFCHMYTYFESLKKSFFGMERWEVPWLINNQGFCDCCYFSLSKLTWFQNLNNTRNFDTSQ